MLLGGDFLYTKLTEIDREKALIIWLSYQEQQDSSILQLIEKCKDRIKVILFLSGNKYTLKETIDKLITNHIKRSIRY